MSLSDSSRFIFVFFIWNWLDTEVINEKLLIFGLLITVFNLSWLGIRRKMFCLFSISIACILSWWFCITSNNSSESLNIGKTFGDTIDPISIFFGL